MPCYIIIVVFTIIDINIESSSYLHQNHSSIPLVYFHHLVDIIIVIQSSCLYIQSQFHQHDNNVSHVVLVSFAFITIVTINTIIIITSIMA